MSKIIINPDEEMVALAREMLKNKNGYCPCALYENEDTKCMCKFFRDLDEGMCNCGLYIKIKDEK